MADQIFVEPRSPDDEFAPQLKTIWEAFYASRQRTSLLWLGAGLVAVVGATAFGQIRLNAWNQPFYDALFRKDLPALGYQLLVFAGIASFLLVLNVAQTWLNLTAKVNLREGLTRDLFAQWLTPDRAFLLAGSGEIGVNPDQRIHEDARHLAELSIDLGVGLLQATLLLASFITVLWALSEGVTFELPGRSLSIPGYMVWAALFYAGTASWASWRVGRPLILINTERYAREADLRFALMHVNEHADGIAVYRGEAGERDRLGKEFDRLLLILRRLVRATTNLTWLTAGYGWFTIAAPIVVASPAYFAGHLTVGGLLMAVGAFNQVQQSLRWFVDNFGAIADWRATLFRVGDFRRALIEMDEVGKEASRVEVVTTPDNKLRLDDLCIFSPSGCTTLNEEHVEIAPSQHVLIIGAPGSGKTSLFRAMAGLWRWGTGTISLPPAEGIMFMPERPYIVDGALRDVLAYPGAPDRFAGQEFLEVLTRMGLSHLSDRLDHVEQWDRELTAPEQQALAFARVLLHKPRWLLIDEAIESLSPEARKAFFDVFEHELAATAVIYIDGPQAQDKFYTRVLYLNMNPQGQRLKIPALPSSTAAKEKQTLSANPR
jgi:vitamin B12/bleomycin/antimicrobial peptide transport system ATP-binding/permease protein